MSITISVFFRGEQAPYVSLPEIEYDHSAWETKTELTLSAHLSGTTAYWKSFTTLISDAVPFVDGELDGLWLLRALKDERVQDYILMYPVPPYETDEPGKAKLFERPLFGGHREDRDAPRSWMSVVKKALGYEVKDRGYKRVWKILADFSWSLDQPIPKKTPAVDYSHPLTGLMYLQFKREDPDDEDFEYIDILNSLQYKEHPAAASSAATFLGDVPYYCGNPFGEPSIFPAVADEGLFPFDGADAACVSSSTTLSGAAPPCAPSAAPP